MTAANAPKGIQRKYIREQLRDKKFTRKKTKGNRYHNKHAASVRG